MNLKITKTFRHRTTERCSPAVATRRPTALAAAFMIAFWVLASVIWLPSSGHASKIRYAWTNWQTGLPLTNTFIVVHVGDINSAGGSTIQGLPMRVTPQPDGLATNDLPAGNYLATNAFAADAIYFTPIEDSGPTVYSFTQPGIRRSGGNYFIQQIITNGGAASVTYNAVTNALGYTPPQGSALTNSFDPTNSAATAAASERAALILTNAAATAAIIASNTAALTIATNLSTADRNALISSNALALAALSATNTAILGTATNLTTAERAALIATNALALSTIIATNTAALTISTNLATAERSALIASNSLALAALSLTNTAILNTATNLSTAERSALIATNSLALAAIIATNTANLTITTNLTVAERNALIATNNLLLADILSATNGMLSIMTNIAQSVSGSGNFVAINNGIATNPIVYGSNGLTVTNSAGITIIGTSPTPSTWSFKQLHNTYGSGGIGNNPPQSDFILTGPTINEPVMFWITNAAGHGNMVGMALQSVYLSSLWLNGVQVTNLNGATGSVGAGSGVTVTTNGTTYTVALNPTNITAQQSFSLGGGPTFSMSTNLIGISNSIARGTYQLIAAGVWTNLTQTNWSLNLSAGVVYAETNLTAVFSLMTNTFNTTNWAIVAAPGAAPTPVSYIGSLLQGDGMVITGYFPTSTNLNATIINQVAVASKAATNNLGALAFQGNNTTVSNAQASVTSATATNWVGSRITNRFADGLIFTNPASKTSLTMQSNAIWIGTDGYDANNQGVPNNDFNQYYFSRSGSLFMQVGQNAGSGTEASFQLSDGYQPVAENPQTAFFRVKLDADTAEMDFDSEGAGTGAVFTLHTYHAPKFLLNEYDPNGDYSPSDVIFGVNGADGYNGNAHNQYGRSLHIISESNTNGGAGGNIFIGGGVGDTGQPNGNVVITNGSFIGAMNGNGIGLTNLNWAVTNVGRLATNYGNYVATNTGGSLSNFVLSTVAGTTNLTRFNVTSNLLIAGVSQEQIFTGKIKLTATNGVPWSMVYYRLLTYWTNAGSGYGVITNGNGATPQWNLKDASGNTLSFKSASSSPQGPWTPNFIGTNAPIGDWGRISDFGSGGNAEAWTVTNIPISAITETNSNPDFDVMNYNPVTGKMFPAQYNIAAILNDGIDAGGSDLLNLGNVSAAAFSGIFSGDGSTITNIMAQPDLTFFNNTIYATTNTAPIFDNTNDLIIGKVNVGPAQRFSVSLSAYTNATLSAGARGDLVYSNFDTGTITRYSFSIPAGVLATDTQTNELCIPDATPNSRFWLTNCFAVPGTTRITRK